MEKGGSRHKHTNLADSDLDLKVDLPGNQPMTTKHREKITGCLDQRFGSHRVNTSNPRIHIIQGEVCSIDVVPVQSTYAQKGFHTGLPKNPFQKNRKAQMAVRDTKLQAMKQGTKLRGYDVEKEVLQQQHLDLNQKAHMQLQSGRGSKAFSACWLSVSLLPATPVTLSELLLYLSRLLAQADTS